MINRQALAIVLAAAAITTTNAFVAPSHMNMQRSTIEFYSSITREDDIEKTRQVIVDHADTLPQGDHINDTSEEDTNTKMIMDIPPMPATLATPPSKPAAAKKVTPKKKGNPHKSGVFSPIVVAAGAVLGEKTLNQVRGKVIAIHSDLIKDFVNTADSDFGKGVLKQLFKFVDADNSGYLDKKEVAVALNLLGFKWLGEKQVAKIFERADANGDEEISLEEFMEEAPKTLRTNLIKLAKTNGGDMGLLV